jgi:hypothetical protein
VKIKVMYGQRWLQSRWLPESLRCEAVVLYPFVLFEGAKDEVPKTTVRHEMVHVRQTREMGWLKFAILYHWFFFRDLIRYKDAYEAYRRNPYEEEAYRKQKWITLTEEEKKAVGWK